MPRATNAPASRARRKKILKMASGFRGGHRRLYKTARQAVERSLCFAYRDRRARKRDFRRLWIARINAAARACGVNYSRFMQGLKMANVEVNRKMLADLAVTDEVAFNHLVEVVKAQLGAAPQA